MSQAENDSQIEAEIEDLVETLAPEPIEVNLFRGLTSGRDGPRLFGGHVIAQSLMAAYETVEDRVCHSLHCYFIRPGDPSIPVLYDVDRARDGSSFTTRRVRAIQHGQQIFNLAASFQVAEDGLEHQTEIPSVAPPDALMDTFEQFRKDLDKLPEEARRMMGRPRPIEQRSVNPRRPTETAPPFSNIWMRARATIGPDQHLHQAILAYASDMGLLETSMRPHGITWQTGGLQSASLDHAIWFHRPCNFNDWHLYAQESPSASGARGFVRGQVFSADGILVASVAQEGLIRQRKPR
ncbi:MAG TPA: acyl-CoA thioesterase II [Caulobacteraceae bacterium]|jgi:acyl-CoA thioesterase-2|nr:acyl-CoA thioesterase II [Caulobacteraceae bacterium]